MERLTRRSANGTGVYATPSGEPIEWENNRHNVLQKLADYENLEEQGRLVKLPCKVGDTVWDNDYGRPYAYTITAFSFGECEGYIDEPVTTKEVVFYYTNSSGSITGSFAESEIGKSVFLNKSEAEAKLKELRHNEPCCRCDSRRTNSDKIRNMSDEELAEFLDIVEEDGISSQCTNLSCDCCCEKTECSKCWKDWLQSEVE